MLDVKNCSVIITLQMYAAFRRVFCGFRRTGVYGGQVHVKCRRIAISIDERLLNNVR